MSRSSSSPMSRRENEPLRRPPIREVQSAVGPGPKCASASGTFLSRSASSMKGKTRLLANTEAIANGVGVSDSNYSPQ